MATAKLMASPNSDLKRRSSSSSSAKSSLSDLEIHRQNSINTTTADDSTSLSLSTAAPAPERRSVEEVWREIVAGRMEKCKEEMKEEGEMMTLEDFLAKVEAKKEVKVEIERMVSGGGSGVFGFGMEEIVRGKRKGVAGFEADKAALQRQRRMIKNRESAARSRERKQAYQAELESMVVKLEEENELLLKEKAERTKGRLKQLMEKVIPVVEKRRPQRVLKRVRSAHW